MHTVYVVFDRTQQIVYEKVYECSQEAVKDYYHHRYKLNATGFTVNIETTNN